jgi:hypothetical protein
MHLECDGAAKAKAVTHPGEDLDFVLLDLHPPAAAVTALAASQMKVDILGRNLQPRWDALDNADERLAVGLARGNYSQNSQQSRCPFGFLTPMSLRTTEDTEDTEESS